jgi:CheY-like chemotaxis protein
LAIVSRLVALMNGRVEVSSEFGKGSCFSFTAQFGIATARPALSGARQTAPDESPVSSASPVIDRPLHILIADDSHDNRALIEAYLKKTPFRVEEAEDGQQAIDKFKAGRFDLVLMDIQMPVVDGYEATQKIRGWERENGRRRTPVVALTASALEDAADRSIAAGCDAHVTKPVKKSRLLEAIRDAVKENPLADERSDVVDLKENVCRTE